jgi:hypothetical protein
MKKVAILQSNYIPWKGYFDLIASVDEFIFYDDVQYTKNDWRNRNLIKTQNGLHWLSIPVGIRLNREIRDVEIPTSNWQIKHWKTLEGSYKRARYFDEIADWLEPLYTKQVYGNLSQLNQYFISKISTYLDIKTKFSSSWDYPMVLGKTCRLVDLCLQVNASEYISGPSAINYIDKNLFSSSNIKLTWFSYNGYPEYDQLWGDFKHEVTILDLLFNTGKHAVDYMKIKKK